MTYIAQETLISSIINALFSMAFFLVFFHGATELTLGANSQLTLDFLPQAFFVGLFAALPASLLTIKRIKSGSLTPTSNSSSLPHSLLLRIAVLALSSLVVFGAGAVLLFSLLPTIQIGFYPAIIFKTVYGVVITLCITPAAVRAAMSSRL